MTCSTPLHPAPEPQGFALSRRRILFGCACCVAASLVLPTNSPAGESDARPPLAFEEIADRVWRHTSWQKFSQGWAPSNGLVVQGPRGVLLVDTAWTADQTIELLDRIEAATSIRRPLTAVVTHGHDDRLAGLEDVHRRGNPSLAHEKTAAFTRARGLPTEFTRTWSGEKHRLEAIGRKIELFYPGAAHTYDNTVAFVEDAQVLFGGCIIRALDQTALGNIADADLCHWPIAARAVLERYEGRSKIVVPGHGESGSAALLAHTVLLASVSAKTGCG